MSWQVDAWRIPNDLAIMKLVAEFAPERITQNNQTGGGYSDRTPLHVVTQKSCYSDCRLSAKCCKEDRINFLLSHGADVNAKSKHGYTPGDYADGRRCQQVLRAAGGRGIFL